MFYVYSIENSMGIYYGSTGNLQRRWDDHKRLRKGIVGKMLQHDENTEFTVLETYDCEDEARVTEAMLISYFPSVNLVSPIIELMCPSNTYMSNYRLYRDDIYNKKTNCKHCNKYLIDRNLPRHLRTCKLINKKIDIKI